MTWRAVGEYVWTNKLLIGGYVGLLVSAAVKVLPIPGTPFHLYTFLYDWSHQFLNVNNTRLNTSATVTPPAPQPSENGRV